MNLASVSRFIRSYLHMVLLAATAFGLLAIGWIVNGSVIYLDLMPAVIAGFFLVWIVGFAVLWTTRTIRPGAVVIVAAIAILLASAAWFLWLWTNNTHWHDREQ
ncbi:MAG TPA: hypothetical protein VHV77_00755, partial [Pirellulales bacterium]|nr:hypothetical protein [Pirellulales bacterium]